MRAMRPERGLERLLFALERDVVDASDDESGAETPQDGNAESIRKRSRILIALLGLAGVLWPILNEMLRALISFLHSK